MPKYRAYITVAQYRAYEFEAEDEVAAWDYMDTYIYQNQNDVDRLLRSAQESGPDQITLDDIGEI